MKNATPKGGGGTGPIGGGGPSRALLNQIAKQFKDLGKSFERLARSPIGGGGTGPIGGNGPKKKKKM